MNSAENVPKSTPIERKRHAGGRPRACNRRVQAMILKVTRSGAARSVIAAYAGVSPRTLHRFIQLAEKAAEKRALGSRLDKSERELRQFCLDFHEAEASAEIAALGVIMSVIRGGDWRAALTFLERRYPERWARRRIRATVPAGNEGEPATRNEPSAQLTREQLKAELARRGWPMDIFAEGRDSGPAELRADLSRVSQGRDRREVCDGLVRSLR